MKHFDRQAGAASADLGPDTHQHKKQTNQTRNIQLRLHVGKKSDAQMQCSSANLMGPKLVLRKQPVDTHFCAVCLSDTASDPVMTPCSHWFCRRCLAQASEQCGRRCPLCRRSIFSFVRTLL